jgi:hypothetical protein
LRYWVLASATLLGTASCDSPPPPPANAGVSWPVASEAESIAASASELTDESMADSLSVEMELEPRFLEGPQPIVESAPDIALDDSGLAETPAPFEFIEFELPDPLEDSNADLSLRNGDYPRTYIESIHVDLTSPKHWVRLSWKGPDADRQETGPFHSSPGRGLGRNNCDDFDESIRDGSNCTPKGDNVVEGFSDYLPSVPQCRFVTWFDMARQIAFHSHWQVPSYPASHGCVRLSSHAAQLIHNNARIGETRVNVDGTWSR